MSAMIAVSLVAYAEGWLLGMVLGAEENRVGYMTLHQELGWLCGWVVVV